MRTKGVFILAFIVCWTAVCNCEDGFLYDYGIGDTTSKELAEDYLFRADDGTCTSDTDCSEKQKCSGEFEQNKCVCGDGLIGDNCEIEQWCKTIFKDCKNENGTCEYSKKSRRVVCTCPEGKKLLPENICKETCADETECNYGGKCEEKGGNRFCSCKEGLIGDKCETVFECSSTGKYKDCTSSGGKCIFDGSKAVCECSGNKKLNDKENVCKECDCGDKGTCKFVNGQKTCDCIAGNADKGGKCTECDCGSKGTCKFVNGQKTCNCEKGNADMDGTCTECDCGSKGTCKFVNGQKTCNCEKGNADKDGTCTGCDCGSKGTCKFVNGQKTCNCKEGNADKDGTCTETCTDEKDCKHGAKCEGKDGVTFCNCNPALSGDKCETIPECSSTGKYKGCSSSGGNCTFDGNAAVCICSGSKKLHDEENICKETCADEKDCKHGGKCEGKDGVTFCNCNPALSGDKCETVPECSSTGKYKGCTSSGGNCTFDGNAAVCICSGSKKLDDKENICKECDCSISGTCKFENGQKKCDCFPGFADKNGKCTECVCGPVGTCRFENGKKKCDCDTGFADKDGKCTETCADETECKYGGKCEEKGGNRFCSCKEGLIGDKCETVFECSSTGKYKDCTSSGGKCIFDGSKAVCECSGNKKLNENENVCKETCSEDKQCTERQICKEKDEWKSCQCADGLSGDNCEKLSWCDDAKKFKNCKSINGTCQYIGDKRIVDCICAEGRKFHLEEKRCRETCANDNECKYGGKCEEKGGNNFCSCNQGLIGDKCETVFDCSSNGKYKSCKSSGGNCTYDGNKAVCVCSGKKILDDKTNMCKECDCGPKGTCTFENGVKKCDCQDSVEKNGRCTETCSNDDCGYGSECRASGDFSFCVCKKGLSGDKCDVVDECGGKFKNCDSEKGDCEYNVDKKEAECICPSGKELNNVLNYCQTKCTTQEECKNGAKCDNGFCQCLPGTEGDDCSTITACETLDCDAKDAKCEYDSKKNPNTYCVCDDKNHIFVEGNTPKEGRCVEKCKPTNYCENEATCNTQTNRCVCKPNTSGDKCENLIGCDPLNCTGINADCVYNAKEEKVTCKCIDKNFYYESGECKSEWCKKGCNLQVSKCEYNQGVGVCICKEKGYYYDYASKNCKPIDKCFKTKCEGNQICKQGKCDCPDNHKKNGTICERKDLCTPNDKCFSGALCEERSPFGYVKCFCNSTSFYSLNNKRCEDSSCFLPSADKKNCKQPCPSGMTFKDNNCKFNDDSKNCADECGFLGWCEKVSATTNKCICHPTYAELDKNKTKCVLKSAAVCPAEQKDNKCICKGKYKNSENGITCELKSCSDEEVQKECKSMGAPRCVDNWKNNVGYKCVCPDGYITDENKVCIDPCSQKKKKDECSSNGQVCYNGAKDKDGDCRCLPTFSYDETKKTCGLSGKNTFMIHGLPVLSEKYKTIENNINKVALNIDVLNSMKQSLSNLQFVHVFSFKVETDVLLCDVWLQFKPSSDATFNASLEVQRWKSLTVEGKNQRLLPPQLLLSSNIEAVSEEELSLCSASVQQSVCGSGSTCGENKCSCKDGFREIDSTIKVSGEKRIVRCEDIDECADGKNDCKDNSTCVNTLGSYFCKCKPGFQKAGGDANAMDKEACRGLCDSNPCVKGSCKLTENNTVDCTCQKGYTGSFCNKEDVNLAKAGNATKVVGAVLGTLLAIVIILIIVYIVRQRKNSYSEDFTPAPRVDNAEMSERRPMRGVTNRAFQ